MDIDNDTNQPVDYDIDIEGGGDDDDMAAAEVTGSGFVGTPRFRLAAHGRMRFELSSLGNCDHTFLIDGATRSPTVVQLLNAPSDKNVTLKSVESGGLIFYRAVIDS